MPIIVTLDKALQDKGVTSKELAEYVGITQANMSLLRSGKVKGVRFSTLEAICSYLSCTPGDLLDFAPDTQASTASATTSDGSLDKGQA